MSFKQLRQAAEEINGADLLGVTPQIKICIYKNLIVTACTMIKFIVPNILWGVVVREALTAAINILNELCPKENPETA